MTPSFFLSSFSFFYSKPMTSVPPGMILSFSTMTGRTLLPPFFPHRGSFSETSTCPACLRTYGGGLTLPFHSLLHREYRRKAKTPTHQQTSTMSFAQQRLFWKSRANSRGSNICYSKVFTSVQWVGKRASCWDLLGKRKWRCGTSGLNFLAKPRKFPEIDFFFFSKRCFPHWFRFLTALFQSDRFVSMFPQSLF